MTGYIMRLGFGLYRHQLDDAHFKFARQFGATDLVIHYVDYFRQADSENPASQQPTGGLNGWGRAGDEQKIWSVEELSALRRRIEAHHLRFYAIENFDPAHWYDVILGGPKRTEQIAGLKQIVRNVAEAGIGVIGYNFSLAGVFGRARGPWARGDAESLGLQGEPDQTPIPEGMVWNMRYRDRLGPGVVPMIDHETLWHRLEFFLAELVPVAEACGVRLAAHPDDPPLPRVRGTPRLVYQPSMYDRLLGIVSSRANALEYCLGTLAEMTEAGEGCRDLYPVIERHARQGALAYVHFRNVRGRVPVYHETFVDDGDLDMAKVIRILREARFDGVLIPDHTPEMSCPAGWYAGMAYAMGYMKALLGRDKSE
jgi:mannonate dehydratase